MRCLHKNRLRIFAALLALSQCLGCVSTGDEPFEDEIVALRQDVLTTMREEIGKLSDKRTFCCQVCKGWPEPDPAWLVKGEDYPYGLGVVGIDGSLVHSLPSSSHDGALGERILASLLNCSAYDVVCVGALRKREVRTAGLAWFGGDGASFAGIAVLTKHSVYFIHTEMDCMRDADSALVYDIFWAEPPYYIWQNPYWALRLGTSTKERTRRIRKKIEKMYQDRDSCSDCCFDNLVTAFRIDISPDEFPKIQQN